MNRRNFKVRLKNINLKQTFILEHSPTEHEIYERYDKMLSKQGLCMVDHKTDGTTKTYTYYPYNLELKHRKEQRAKNRTKTGKPRPRRPGFGFVRPRPIARRIKWRKPEHEVLLEITMLHPTPKYRL